MDFHLATPNGDVYLFSEEAGRAFCLLLPPSIGSPAAPAGHQAEPAPSPPPPAAPR